MWQIQKSIVATVELESNLSEVEREQIRVAVAVPTSGEFVSRRSRKIADEQFRQMFGLEFENVLNEIL